MAVSPSSRRAWIEIDRHPRREGPRAVALLAEGVDRNRHGRQGSHPRGVALLAEGVDRNWFGKYQSTCTDSRPPRGGRG